jgi:hypothetical protein
MEYLATGGRCVKGRAGKERRVSLASSALPRYSSCDQRDGRLSYHSQRDKCPLEKVVEMYNIACAEVMGFVTQGPSSGRSD